jgi:hypothetical protein
MADSRWRMVRNETAEDSEEHMVDNVSLMARSNTERGKHERDHSSPLVGSRTKL